ncbi:AAA family ATPase, partial [Vibrio parahaemolyticus]|uniref:AAA family ATPase n=1 Tax=Vibrio parahaemolyticus TaxID=670 RepID=UPI00117593B0
DAKAKGYKISRNGTGKLANNLSEGEKTAIAFVYFVTKLKEHDNDIKETIVVVDDPVSSFDSNHLFHSYSFLKKHCENAKQLFVMTH